MNLKTMFLGRALSFVIVMILLSISPKLVEAKFDPSMDLEIEKRVRNLNSVMTLKYNDDVRNRIYFYTTSHRKTSELLLGRVTMYFPLFEKSLRERNLPDELKYLPLIESELIPHAVSRAGAAGLWQFMRGTALLHGLKVNQAVDERRDAIKSTDAALDHLELLYSEYQDWTMVIAAYNCGSGTVNRAIKRANGKRDYWSIRSFLPKETQMYVPKFIAMSYLMSHFHVHDIVPMLVEDDLRYTATAKTFDKVDLNALAKSLDLEPRIVKFLNASYIKNFIPKSDGNYYLTLPEKKMFEYIENGKENIEIVYVRFSEYKPGVDIPENIGSKNINHFAVNIFKRKSDQPYIAEVQDKIDQHMTALVDQQRIKKVKIGKGQSLADIANTFGTSIGSLIELNNIDVNSPPKYGDILLVKI